jgi:hypothetical protein
MAVKCRPAVATCTLLLCNVTMQSMITCWTLQQYLPSLLNLVRGDHVNFACPRQMHQELQVTSSATALQMPLAEAYQKCRHQWMREALATWITRQGWQHVLQGQALEARTSDSCSEGC